MADELEIDDSLYSRQRYVLGDDAMRQLATSDVILFGVGGVGVELAKNVILAGVKSLTLVDDNLCSVVDMGVQYYVSKDDVLQKRTRAEASVSKLKELNPNVTVVVKSIDLNSTWEELKNYQCVALTDVNIKTQVVVNEFCRNQDRPIKFISADVAGLCGRLFCDFGDTFIVKKVDGEEAKEIFIGDIISDGSDTIIKCLEYRRHGLVSKDVVKFTEIKGMTELNGFYFCIDVKGPDTFSIPINSSSYSKYLHGGIVEQMKVEKEIHFSSLESQIFQPGILSVDLSNLELPLNLHVGLTVSNWLGNKNLNNVNDFIEDCKSIIKKHPSLETDFNENALRVLYQTKDGQFAPICSVIASIAAQEVLKAVTGTFTPLTQWLYIDAFDLANAASHQNETLQKEHTRYTNVIRCLNEEALNRLKDVKLFLVGCGAIGCEMMKNFSLLGIGSGENGLITVTDNDLIEKSNLNRQFLFRPQHIQKSKSIVAADVIKGINEDLKVSALQHKVCPETEKELFNDKFHQSQTVIVNALDNVEARRYVDSRCVSNKIPLLETGTMGPKGHVQVIYPYLTESYGEQRDPIDEEVPYCTLKSFPQVIEHTIQWARDKFESCFSHKPQLFNKFWSTHKSIKHLSKSIQDSDREPDDFTNGVGVLINKPKTWNDCVRIARIKFERYFNHTAKQLLHVFPVDTILSDGSLFWQSPKRPPRPIEFNQDEKLHLLFVQSHAKLTAAIHGIEVDSEEYSKETVCRLLDTIKVPVFSPSNKVIETDEKAKSNTDVKVLNDNKVEIYRNYVIKLTKENNCLEKDIVDLNPLTFEKDDDANGHIDFITAASNLRAEMYSIEMADRYKTKRIAGKIIPAIATTTAAIAGLASIELVKMILNPKLDVFRNTFLNLALPMCLLSEPGPPAKTVIKGDLHYTVWDCWDVHGNDNYLLKDFIAHFKGTYNLNVSMVVHGVRMIYVPVMPGHMKRRNDKMTKLLKPTCDTKYFDLTVGFENEKNDDEDLSCPPIRYHFQKE